VQTCISHLRGGRLERGLSFCWAGRRIHAVGMGVRFVWGPAGGTRGAPLWSAGPRTLFGLAQDGWPLCEPESATFEEVGWKPARPAAGQDGVSSPLAWAPISCGRLPAAQKGRLFGFSAPGDCLDNL